MRTHTQINQHPNTNLYKKELCFQIIAFFLHSLDQSSTRRSLLAQQLLILP